MICRLIRAIEAKFDHMVAETEKHIADMAHLHGLGK